MIQLNGAFCQGGGAPFGQVFLKKTKMHAKMQGMREYTCILWGFDAFFGKERMLWKVLQCVILWFIIKVAEYGTELPAGRKTRHKTRMIPTTIFISPLKKSFILSLLLNYVITKKHLSQYILAHLYWIGTRFMI